MSTKNRLFPLNPVMFGLILIMALTAGCSAGDVLDPGQPTGQSLPLDSAGGGEVLEGGTPAPGEDEEGLVIQLSDGRAQPAGTVPDRTVSGEPLAESEIEAILSRLPELVPGELDQVEFNLPDEVLPPPRPGETISEQFPPPQRDPEGSQTPGGPLEVLRYAPQGDVPVAPYVNVTFNQPMIALNTVDATLKTEVPVQLQPEVEGTWRWLGTRTINFQADSSDYDRLPMATDYRVRIPAGTRSAAGKQLEEAVEFSFSTPPPTIQDHYPQQGPQPLDPLFFLSFDQRINPEAVLSYLTVYAGNQEVAVRMAAEDEIEADQPVRRLVEKAGESRWLAFRASEDLPADTQIRVVVGAGTPSAEGPLTTETEQTFSFQTYPALRVEEHGCSYGDQDCRPRQPFFIRFNNPLDREAYQEGLVTIQPELPHASVDIFGNTLNIKGVTQGSTTYTVTLSRDIQDVFGQSLGRDRKLKFKVGRAEPVLFGPGQTLVTVDPALDQPGLQLYALNYSRIDLDIYRVEPANWPAFQDYLRKYQRNEGNPTPPGELIREGTMPIEAASDVLTEVSVDLSDHMEGSSGHFVVIARPPKGLFQEDRYWETIQVWVQVTQIGLDAFVDPTEMVVWTTALQDGQPLPEVQLQSPEGGNLGVTDSSGVARFDLPSSGLSYLVGRRGDDRALLVPSSNYWQEQGWRPRSQNDHLRWYVFDDRGMYKPGEEVHVKGWLRRVGGGEQGDVGPVDGDGLQVDYTVVGPQGNEFTTGSASLNSWGGFDLSFELPENVNLGYAALQIRVRGALGSLGGTSYQHRFQIQEFRRPEFEVSARNETTGPYLLGERAVLAVEAAYYAGGPLPNAEVNWRVNTSPTSYQPPNWPEFTFGYWTPWWFYGGWGDGRDGTSSQAQEFSGSTDASGNHYLQLDFESLPEPRPYSLLAEGTVTDVNRQAWAGRTDLIIHPAEIYVGLRTERYFVRQGQPMDVDLIVADLDGRAVSGQDVLVTAARLDWTFQEGGWQQVEVDPQECRVRSEEEPVSCRFETDRGGRYRITAQVTDQHGRRNQSRLTRWVSGGKLPPQRDLEKEQLTLIPDQETYQPGETAEILVQAPFDSGQGLLTLSRSGLLSAQEFTFQDGSATLEVPITEKHLPNLHVQVDLVGAAPRLNDQGEDMEGAPARPAFASGQLNLDIPPLGRTLEVSAVPRDQELGPGEETTLDLVVRDARGEPVPEAEIAAVVVDEAILALTDYQLADPLQVFYGTRPAEVASYYTRSTIKLANPEQLLEQGQPPAQPTLALEKGAEMVEEEAMAEAPAADLAAGRGGGEGAPPQAIDIRRDFNPLALFAPEVRTDQEGKARVTITLPDNLTRYRVMVVAVDQAGSRFGSAEANLTARLPLMVRPAAPRFLNFGDHFQFPIVLQNQTGEDLEARVVLRATNLELSEAAGLTVQVPARDRVEVRFPTAAELAGTARFQVAVVSGSYADAARGELPVYTPATTEAFATYGVLDEGAVSQPIASPEDVFPQFGGLEVSTSSTALQALTDAVLYLVSYPYECTEQLASRVLGVAALRDVLSAFEAEGLPAPGEMEAAVVRDLEQLSRLQNRDGGFPYWRRGQRSIPFNTIHAAHALTRAEQKGFEIPEGMKEQVLPYLRDIESHYPHWYSANTRNTLSAYALYVRDLMGDSDPAKARKLLQREGIENLSLDALGWTWGVLSGNQAYETELESIRRYVGNRVVETAGSANFRTSYADQDYLLLRSNRRTDGILLDALIEDQPQSDLIPKLVSGLLAHRTRGRWGNTQENVFILLALDRYFNTFESQTPEFVARIWLGDTYAAEHEFVGRTTERRLTEIPLSYLVGQQETRDLVLSKEGPGRLYYRLGLKYAPTDLELDPRDQGFVVQRSYEAVDDPEDVRQNEDGSWVIKAGARVRVRLTMVADNRRYHVALVDPLPAGLEIINPALAVSGSIPQDPNSGEASFGWWWRRTWYEHQNMRDERAEAFASLLWEGVHEYTYVARATTPGTYVVPPAKAEEMYSPEVFGRSASASVIVE